MILQIENSYTKILNGSRIPQLRMELSFKIPTNIYILKAKMPDKPWWLLKKIASQGQTVNLLDLRSLKFPTGLVQKVLDYCTKNAVPVSVRDQRIFKQGTGKNWYFTKTPRLYQIPSIEAALEKKRGILALATRAGKTVVAQCIVAKLKLPTIFFVKSIELLDQAHASFQKAFPLKKIGRIGAGHYDVQEITIAIIQSLLKEKELFEDLYDYFQIAIFDECHNFGGLKFYHSAMRFNAPYRMGCSGTAFRNDEAGLLLTALCGEIISKITTQELEALDVVYKTKIIMQKNFASPMFPPSGRDWAKMYAWGIVSNQYRNILIVQWAQKLHDAKRTVLIIVKEIKHGDLIKLALTRLIVPAPRVEFMNGQEDKHTRKRILADFCKGNLPFLIGTKIYNEGIDFVGITNPDIKGKSVILAAGGKSKINAIQTSARPTTKEKGSGFEEDALIIDFADVFNKKFRQHSLDRVNSYKNIGGFSVTVIDKPEDYKL